MRVLYFSDNLADHNRRFLDKLVECGIEVWFLEPTTDHLPDSWLPEGVHWIQAVQKLRPHAGPAEFAQFVPELKHWLREIRPDLVHAGPTDTCGFVTALSEFHPWLLMSWGSDILYSADHDEERRRATVFALSSADGFFCDCDAVRVRARELASVPDARTVQLPWGIRAGSFSRNGECPDRSAFSREPGTRVLLSTRSWEPLYGIDVLLGAFRESHSINPSLRLLLLGNGSGAADVRQFVSDHGLNDVIHLPGQIRQQDMAKWFRAADIYVSCTRSDGTSVSLLQAMATGLPVVVSDLPANREWVENEHNGWLAPVNSVDGFATQILRAAALGPLEVKAIAERNQNKIEGRADWDRNFPKLLKMYDQLTALSLRDGSPAST
jgi:glycosyltransferase involved in cell wall biosynthesis